MTDAIDRFRHWLIRKLSCGDMMILNAHIRSDGKFIPRNLGPATIAEAEIDLAEGESALSIGRGLTGSGKLKLAESGTITFHNVYIQSASIPQEKP